MTLWTPVILHDSYEHQSSMISITPSCHSYHGCHSCHGCHQGHHDGHQHPHSPESHQSSRQTSTHSVTHITSRAPCDAKKYLGRGSLFPDQGQSQTTKQKFKYTFQVHGRRHSSSTWNAAARSFVIFCRQPHITVSKVAGVAQLDLSMNSKNT